MFESHVVTSVDRMSFYFRFEDFFSNLPLQTFIYCVTDQPSITRSRRSVLNFKLSVLTESQIFEVDELWTAAQWALSKNCAKWNYFNSNLCWMQQDVLIKGLRSRILVFRVWPWYSTWTIQVRQACAQKNRLQVAKYNESCTVFFQ